jgi:hypothetical protein
MTSTFDIERFREGERRSNQYDRQLKRLKDDGKEVQCIETAVRGAIENLRQKKGDSFVIYGEPQSGKTEMMICLTGMLCDEGYPFIVHLLNDSVDLLDQNLGRFKESGLAPAARNFSEIMDPAVKIAGAQHVVFCKKNASDLSNLLEKLDGLDGLVIIDDEADYASPNSKVNKGTRTKINELINELKGKKGIYIGVTATPARLDLNNTFENDNEIWVNFPPHTNYTGQDVFFPLEGPVQYQRTLLPNTGADPKHARQSLFSFLANVAYLNVMENAVERNYSILVHTSGKKVDHKTDWGTMYDALKDLADRKSKNFEKYTEAIWAIVEKRYPDADPDRLTHYVLNNIGRYSLIVLNSERDWTQNAGAATNPTSLFTIIIGGNIVSRGVTLNNLLSMFFTRDVKHKIQQDTYIQRARMFGSRGSYLNYFELTIPEKLYEDWHRCFVFHRLALAAIKEGQGSLVWLSDKRISAVSSSSIDKSTVDLNRGEMSFPLFDLGAALRSSIDHLADSSESQSAKTDKLAELIGEAAFPQYLRKYIARVQPNGDASTVVHGASPISGYADGPDIDKVNITRKKGFFGRPQMGGDKYPNAVHHLRVFFNDQGRARLFYKFVGSIQFIKNEK